MYAASASGLGDGAPIASVVRIDRVGITPLAGTMNGGIIDSVRVVDERPWGGTGEVVYVGGDFDVPAQSNEASPPRWIARWNGVAWAAVGESAESGPGARVRAIEVYDDGRGGPPNLCAGGDFQTVGGALGTGIASFDGSSWRALSVASPGSVRAMIVHDDGSGPALFVGGNFRQMRETYNGPWTTARGVAKWDGARWSGLDNQYYLDIFGLGTADFGAGRRLLAFGLGQHIAGQRSQGLFEFVGGAWRPTPIPMETPLGFEVLPDGPGGVDRVYVSFDGSSSRFDGQRVEPLSIDAAWTPSAFGEIAFVQLSDSALHRVLTEAWRVMEGDTWRQFSIGLPERQGFEPFRTLDLGGGPALTACSFDNGLRVYQRRAGLWIRWLYSEKFWRPSACRQIAWFEGAPWVLDFDGLFKQVSPGRWEQRVSGALADICVFDDGAGEALWLLGWFEHDGEQFGPASRLSHGVWERVGDLRVSAQAGSLRSLAVFDSGAGRAIYASAHTFALTTGEGEDVLSGVVRWNGSAWRPVGRRLADRFDGGRGDLFVVDRPDGVQDLYSTDFVVAPLLRLQGETWHVVGSIPMVASSLADLREPGGGSSLYAANFSLTPVNGLSKWDGVRWIPVSGTQNAWNWAIAADRDGDRFVWGQFDSVGGVPTDNFARLILPCVASCAGDVTGDGVVDMADLAALLGVYGEVSPPADIDNSGRVDFADLNLLLAGYGRACP